MWHKSDERKLRAFLRSAQQEPMPDALRGRLQADVEARFARPSPVVQGKLRSRRKPMIVGAAAALLLVFVLLGVALLPTDTGKVGAPLLPSAVADTIEGATAAMAKVEQAHLVGQTWWFPESGSPLSEGEPLPRETWYSAEHGVRDDTVYGPREAVRTKVWIDKRTGRPASREETVMRDAYTHSYIVTPDMFFTYTDTDTTRPVHLHRLWPRQYEITVEGIFRSDWAKYISDPQPRQPGSALEDVTVADDTLDGVPTKRIDYEACYEAYRMPEAGDRPAEIIKGKIWFEADTLRVLRWETLTIQGDDEILSWAEVDYDTPVDASLFEVPAGVEVIDTRLTLERRELVEDSIAALQALPEETAILEEVLVEWDEGELGYVVVDLVENGTRLMRVKGPSITDARDPDTGIGTAWHRQTYTFDLDAQRLIERKLEQYADRRLTVPEHVKFDYSQPGAPRRIDLTSAD